MTSLYRTLGWTVALFLIGYGASKAKRWVVEFQHGWAMAAQDDSTERRAFLKDLAASLNEAHGLPVTDDEGFVRERLVASGNTLTFPFTVPDPEGGMSVDDREELTRTMNAQRADVLREMCTEELPRAVLSEGFNVRYTFSAGRLGRFATLRVSPGDCG